MLFRRRSRKPASSWFSGELTGERQAVIRSGVLLAFILFAAFARLVPHPPNFTPVGAIALFGGAHFGSPVAAVVVPLAALFISDLALAAAHGWTLGVMTVVIYACIVAAALLGVRMRGRAGWGRVSANSLVAAVLFFVVTNFAVWIAGAYYPVDFDGLLACYAAALPFFGNTLAGHAVYGIVLFGGFGLLQRRFAALSPAPARA